MSKITHVIKRSGAIVPFNLDRIANAIYRAAVSVGGRDRERARDLAQQVEKQLEEQCLEGKHPHIEEIQDVVEKVLIENGHAKVAKNYIIYRMERARSRDSGEQISRPSGNIPWSKLWQSLDWAVSHNVQTVEALNERIRKGEFAQIVSESEAAYEGDVDIAAEMIVERRADLKIVLISGPSSSGKTTTTQKIEGRLQRMGMKFASLNVDNYFFDLDMHPKDEFGDYDFETPQALDLGLINDHLKRLSQGEEVLIPTYDFKTGKRTLDRTPFRLEAGEILLIDSLHGLYPEMTGQIPIEIKMKLYIEPLLQMKTPQGNYIRWTDLRLIRRMLRDAVHRAYKPQQTLEHWHYVRSSELHNIIPYITTADHILNSSMPYEIALYRPKMLELFIGWREQYNDDPLREDAHMRAERVCHFLEAVEPVEDDTPVPKESVLREFIGGGNVH